MNIWIYTTPVIVVVFFATAYWFFGRGVNTAATADKDHGDVWWTANKDIVQSLVLVGLAIVAVNVLCAKIGFGWWHNVWNHEAFWWLNTSLLFTIFLTMVAKNLAVKLSAAVLALIIVVGIVNIGSTDKQVATLKANSWSKEITLVGKRVTTLPDSAVVEFQDTLTDKITVVPANSRDYPLPSDMARARLRSKESIRYIVERQ